jgi:SP family general alpha glucoside:H+ symporter-like MFS transporter
MDKHDVQYVENRRPGGGWEADLGLSQAAEDRVDAEHSMTVRDAIHAYPSAIFWCLVISTCVIVEG